MLQSPTRLVSIPYNVRPLIFRASIKTDIKVSPIKTVDLAYTSIGYNTIKPPLIILPGMLATKDTWRSIGDALHKECGRKVLCVDLRNQGESGRSSEHTYLHMAEDVRQLMRKLDISKGVILGHSMGGRTAMALSLLYPELVSNVIAVDVSPVSTSPWLLSMHSIFDLMASVHLQPGISEKDAWREADTQLKEMFTYGVLREYILSNNLVKRDSGEYGWKCDLTALKRNFEHIVDFPKSLKGLKYTGSTLFIGAGKSDFIGHNDMPKIKEYFPNADLKVIYGTGHFLQIEKPQNLIEDVKEFLNKQEM